MSSQKDHPLLDIDHHTDYDDILTDDISTSHSPFFKYTDTDSI